MAHEIVFHSAGAGHHPGKRNGGETVYRKVLDTLTFGGTDAAEALARRTLGREPVSVGLESFREMSETGVLAAFLGYLHAKKMNKPFGIPADGAGALAFTLGKLIAGQGSQVGRTSGNLAMCCNSVYWYRLAAEFLIEKKKLSAGSEESEMRTDPSIFDTAGESSWGDDPVFRAAEGLG